MNDTLRNRSAMLSGSTGGIGSQIATRLAGQGWDLVLVNRSMKKSERQAIDLRNQYPEISVSTYQANLLDQTEIVRVCDEISQDHSKLHAVYNIAGLLTDKRISSPQGIEGHFAVNTIAPYLFAKRLSGALVDAQAMGEPSVVVNFTSSAAYSIKSTEVGDLAEPADIGGLMGAYANTKLALMAMTLAMQKEFGQRLRFYSADPGPTKTPMTKAGDGMPWFVRLLVPLIFKAPDVQAQRLISGIQKAVSDDISGVHISQGKRKSFPKMAEDKAFQNELMKVLGELTKQTLSTNPIN
ncbi:MAG: SDR family NAD(P)-dependent oxidoreductase [Planctomycetota bacterium]